MDWFEKRTGFRETHYEQTRAMLKVDGESLCSRVNGARIQRPARGARTFRRPSFGDLGRTSTIKAGMTTSQRACQTKPKPLPALHPSF
jgi:hypothetical protein